jgi:hypothetical protein
MAGSALEKMQIREQKGAKVGVEVKTSSDSERTQETEVKEKEEKNAEDER